MSKECVLTTIPTDSELLEAMQTSWTKGKQLPVTIEWTTDQGFFSYIATKKPNFSYGVAAEPTSFYITENTYHLCKAPDKPSTKVIQIALNKWSKASKNNLLFKQVDKLEHNYIGITFTAPQPHTTMPRSAAFTYDNNGKIYSSFIMLQDDFFHNPHIPGFLNSKKQTIVHEIGHALGIQHPHEYPKLLSAISTAKNPAYCSVVDYDIYVDPNFQNCVTHAKGIESYKCSFEIDNTPGALDIKILEARIKHDTLALQSENESRKAGFLVTTEEINPFSEPAKVAAKGFALSFFDTLLHNYAIPYLLDFGVKRSVALSFEKVASVGIKCAVLSVPNAMLSTAFQSALSFSLDQTAINKNTAERLSTVLSVGISVATDPANILTIPAGITGAAAGERAARLLIKQLPKFKIEPDTTSQVEKLTKNQQANNGLRQIV